MSASAPSLSVVVAAANGFDGIRKTVSHLAAQTLREQLELVIVASTRAHLRIDEAAVAPFGRHRVVEVGVLAGLGRANAAGARVATAPIVAFAEDHSFADPGWAERLIARFVGPYAAVGPAVRNANPRTMLSWADFFIGYGLWADPVEGGEVEVLPGHNTAYRRDVLLGYGDRLEEMLETETLLHWDLRARGLRLFLEPSATIAHANFSRASSWIRAHFFSGWLFAGNRARRMSRSERVVFVLAGPLIPLVRLARISIPLRSPALRGHFLRSCPAVIAGLALDGLGQMLGYAAGPGPAGEQVAWIEADRARHVTPGDRRELWGEHGSPPS